ncbi:MAG TPA: hypothetical protein VLX92_28700 [Kofleriaceae bacterium]|nr:hypothetical protein [Kofleriaceae bacterium]
MRYALVFVVLLGCTKSDPVAKKDDPPAPAVKSVEHTAPAGAPGWIDVDTTAPLDTTLARFAKEAIAAGKKPYAYLHAGWCEPCQAIDKTHATDAKMIDAFAGTAIARIDIDAAKDDALAALGLSAGAIPVFYRLDASGKPTGDKIDGGAWGENIPDNMAPPLKAFFAK